MGMSLKSGLHIKSLLILSYKTLFSLSTNIVPAPKDQGKGQVTMWRENKDLQPHQVSPDNYSGMKTCPHQLEFLWSPFSRGRVSSVKCQFLDKSVVSADHLTKAEHKREVSADVCGSAGKPE